MKGAAGSVMKGAAGTVAKAFRRPSVDKNAVAVTSGGRGTGGAGASAASGTIIIGDDDGVDDDDDAAAVAPGVWPAHLLPEPEIGMADVMRECGIRLQVAKKNVGRPKYSFNALQLRFMPDVYRPPREVIDDIVTSTMKRDTS